MEPSVILAAADGSVAVSLMLIAALAIGAQWLAWRLKVPSILLLLAFGFAVGPGTAWVFGSEQRLITPDLLFGDLLFPLVSLSVGVILFEGGLTLRLKEIHRLRRTVVVLVTVGAAITWGLSAYAAKAILGLPVELAILLGAVLIVTGPTVIGPLLSHIRPSGQVGPILKWEGIVIDPIGALAAVLALEVILTGDPTQATGEVAAALAKTVFAGGALGALGALLMIFLLDRYWIPEGLHNSVSLAMLIVVFTVSNLIQQESGLLTATVMGIVLANQSRVSTDHILEFKENLRVLIIGVLFIVLAARIREDDLRAIGPPAMLFLALLIFVIRPLSVFFSTLGSKLSWRERLMVAGMAPRGIVAAAVSSVFALALESAVAEGELNIERPDRLVALTFLMIVGTVLFYGLLSPILADKLGLSDKDPQGVLFVGATPLARLLGDAIKDRGFRVMLVDTNWHNAAKARLAGLEAEHGNVLEDAFLETLDLRRIGRAIAVTRNAEVNALALQRLQRMLGRAAVFRIPVRPAKESDDDSRAIAETGRRLFSSSVDLATIEHRLEQGWILRSTTLTQSFNWRAYQTLYGLGALVMFIHAKDGTLRPVTADRKISPSVGDTIIALIDPEQLLMPPPTLVESMEQEAAEASRQKQQADDARAG